MAAASAVTILSGLLLIHVLGGDGPSIDQLGGWQPRAGGTVVGITLAVDPFGAGLAALAAALVAVALVFTWRFFDATGGLFHALMLVFLGGLLGFALTGDLFNIFVFFELMSVSAYALTAFRIERPEPLQGALAFAVVNSVGAIMILFGIALLYGRTGALNMAQVGEALAGRPADALVMAAFASIIGGFLVKAAVVPFHFWLADAYAVAPTPAAIVFTGVMSDLGIYAVARVYWAVFEGALAPHADEIRVVLVVMAALSALVGAVMCIVQESLKRLLAFATISQVGIALLGVALLTPEGLAGAALLVPADGLLRAGLFVCLGILVHRCESTYELRLQGRGRDVPRLVWVLFVAGALGLAALPPLGGFTGKSLLDGAATDLGFWWVPIVVTVATAITCAALLRAAGRIFFDWGAGGRSAGEAEESEAAGAAGYTPVPMLLSAVVLVLGGLAFGALPGIADGAQQAAAQFTDRGLYAAAVLGRDLPVIPTAELHGISGLEVALSLAGLVLALGGATAMLRYRRMPFHLDIDSRYAAERMLVRLRRLHSGQIGDYIAWLVIGFAALGGALALAI